MEALQWSIMAHLGEGMLPLGERCLLRLWEGILMAIATKSDKDIFAIVNVKTMYRPGKGCYPNTGGY
jgi:hypothetical protein